MATATKKQQGSMISGVFRDRTKANDAYAWLTNHGFTSNEINVLMSDTTRKFYSDDKSSRIKPDDHAVEGVATGGTVGTVVGATLGAIAAIGTSVLVPGLGIVVAGPIVAGLAGGGAGAVAGGLVGGLIGLGIPESNAAAYEKVLKEGGVVIGVTTDNSKSRGEIEERFKALGADNIVVTDR
jgi:hypothetical protein